MLENSLKFDHKNLSFFRQKQFLNQQQVRWYEELADYDFVIHHIPGTQNSKADILSRLPQYEELLPEQREVTMLDNKRFEEPLPKYEKHEKPPPKYKKTMPKHGQLNNMKRSNIRVVECKQIRLKERQVTLQPVALFVDEQFLRQDTVQLTHQLTNMDMRHRRSFDRPVRAASKTYAEMMRINPQFKKRQQLIRKRARNRKFDELRQIVLKSNLESEF